jgi:hypothetical protein
MKGELRIILISSSNEGANIKVELADKAGDLILSIGERYLTPLDALTIKNAKIDIRMEMHK